MLDIRLGNDGVCPASNGFYIFHGIACQFITFKGDVLTPVDTFLSAHPGETVLMRIRDEHSTGGDFSSRVVTELTPYASRLYNGGSSNPLLKDMRGKLVVLQNFGTIGDLAAVTTAISWGALDLQDNFSLGDNWGLADKWHAIVKQFRVSDDSGADRNRIYGNFLSASGGGFPYFFASGHSSSQTDAPRLLTGWTRGVIDTCSGAPQCIPQYPSVNCFLGTCSVAFEGANTMARDYINTSITRRIGIVFADYPGAGLIGAIINVNSRRQATVTTVSVPSGAVYDGTAKVATARTTGEGGAVIAAPNVSYTPGPGAPVDAGSYTASASFPGNDNYLPSDDSKSFTIAKAPSTVVVTVANATYNGRPHGGSATATGAGGLSRALAIAYSGRDGTTYGPSATAPTAAGDYTASATYAGDANHTGSADRQPFTIAKAGLQAKADNKRRTYGATNPELTGALIGVVPGDTITAAYTTAATAESPVGDYPITLALSDPANKLANYTVTSTNGTLTVTKAALTVTAANATRVYGDSNPAFAATASGRVNGDTLAGLGIACASTATPTSPVGSYDIACTGSPANYAATFVGGTLTVTKAPTALAITSADALALDARGQVTVVARLTWQGGTALAGKRVTFAAGGATTDGTTDANGVATVNLALPSERYTLTASFAGDTNHQASQAARAGVIAYQQTQFVI